ncbi:hypothetical protein ABZY34_27550 [Streptomyces virginiae]|uniref:hypothetical protein n=1 Tax=Streptomyces virginiae TaxID=1961 RepID=UPI0033A17D1F
MKYAFSTLGLPGAPLARSAALAAAHGFHGLEVRAHPEEPLHPAGTAAERAAARRTLTAAGSAVLGVAGDTPRGPRRTPCAPGPLWRDAENEIVVL